MRSGCSSAAASSRTTRCCTSAPQNREVRALCLLPSPITLLNPMQGGSGGSQTLPPCICSRVPVCTIPCTDVFPAGRGAAGAQGAAALGDAGFWPLAVGCGCVAVVLAFLAGLSMRKRYQHWLWVYGAEQSTSLQTSCTVLLAKHCSHCHKQGWSGGNWRVHFWGAALPAVGCRLLLPSSVTLPCPVPP